MKKIDIALIFLAIMTTILCFMAIRQQRAWERQTWIINNCKSKK
jgi:preprotein translocase subunit YajC